MKIYVLNESFQKVTFVDVYKSFIWTDRYQEAGDFEIVTDVVYKDAFPQNYYLWCDLSDRLMIIESVQIDTDPEDGNFLTVSGRSLESILDRRVVWTQTTIDTTLQEGVKKLIDENIISPEDNSRAISNFVFSNNSDSYFTTETISAQYTGDNIYDVICEICKDKKIGFKVILNASNQFEFSLYKGTDRSHGQLTNPYVIFSPKFENIASSQYVQSNKDEKNASLILGEDSGTSRRRATIGTTTGLSRKEFYVDARDIQSETGNIVQETSEGVYNYTKFDSGVYFDYSSGTVTTSGSTYKAIKIKCAPKTTYKLSRGYAKKAMQFQIGGFETEPASGSTCLTNQKWNPKFVWEGDSIGQYGEGNIDLYNRPQYVNEDGSVSTVLSMSFSETEGGQEILIPTVVNRSGTPTILSENEAISWYYSTGEYLGKFENTDAADNYAERLHNQQELLYPDYDSSISSECKATFETGEKVNWLVITLNDSNSLSESFDTLLELLIISGVVTESGYTALLETRGNEKMTEHKAIDSFDGEAEYHGMFKYGTDYFIGDICEFENEYNMECKIRVSELIISQDSGGLLYYPTFVKVET